MEKEEIVNENVESEEIKDTIEEPKKCSKINKFFGVSKFGSSMKIEIMAGIVTFLAMCYILVVNPNSILWGGAIVDGSPTYNPTDNILWPSIFIATAIGAFLGTLLMALFAKMPFGQAPGLGLNSAVGTVIGGGIGFYSQAYGKIEYSFGNAMLLVFISGILFLLLSVVPIGRNKETKKYITLREKIFDGMPVAIKRSIPVGIGLFIAFIALQNASIIVDNEYTLVSLIPLNNKGTWALGGEACCAMVCLFGFVIISILSHYKVKGAIIIGILAATILAIPLKVADLSILKGEVSGISWKFWESFENFFKSTENGGVAFSAFKEGFDLPKNSIMTSIMIIITFSMIDMFDTIGTIVGCSKNAGLVDENEKPLNYNKIMMSDSIATVLGATIGTSTVTTFVESGAGIAAGGRTGLTSLTTAILFLLALFLLPLFAFIPSAAAASALLYVGVLMMSNVVNIDFKNPLNAVPAFLTIITMPLAYSITTGIGLGIISYVVINTIAYLVGLIISLIKKTEKPKWNISIICLIVFILFLVYFLVPTSF